MRKVILTIISIAFIIASTCFIPITSFANEDVTEEVTEEASISWIDSYVLIEESKFREIFDNKEIRIEYATINSNSGILYCNLSSGDKFRIENPSPELKTFIWLQGSNINARQFDGSGESITGVANANSANNPLINILVFGVLGFIVVMVMRSGAKESMAVTSVTPKSDNEAEGVPKVTFNDVEGIEELKSDIMRLVDCLKNPKKYQDMGAKPPKGVILYGPPGTGKTLIAKAIAGEAGVPFYSVVGSDFVEKYVGVGASRVRDLYKKAKKSAPCIVFIDEIDAVASHRGQDDNTEKDQTINALLAELDGFSGNTNVITICATNRLDTLDEAFKRAGRFDLKLAVGLPDKKSRINILNIHAKGKKLSEEIDFEVIANKTVGFSGADLAALLNEAALVAVGKEHDFIDYNDIDDAFFKIVMQGNKKPREQVTETNRIVAWHEAGHTLATKILTTDSVPSVTIIGSSSGAGGVTFRSPKDENILHSRIYLESLVKVMYAGRAAEEVYFDNTECITTGASQDIKQATSIIKEYLGIYGMGDMGMLDISQFRYDYKDILDEASILSKRLYDETYSLLLKNKETLTLLADELLVKETLDEAEIDSIIETCGIKI